MHESWKRAANSLDAVVAALGGDIRDRQTGKRYDPGQAVCREMFGSDWMQSDRFREFDNAEICPPAFFEAVQRLAAKQADWVATD